MQLTRVVSALVGLSLVGTLNVGLAASAQAIPREVPIQGTQPRNQVFFIKGDVGLDFAGKSVVIQRKAFPGSTWKRWAKDKTSKTGKYKIRVFRVAGSRQTCYRVKVRAFNGLENGRSRAKCIIRIF